MVTVVAPKGAAGHVHIFISDPSGGSAIFQFVEGTLVIHHDAQYRVMANSSIDSQQLNLNKYVEHTSGEIVLPGTALSATIRTVVADHMNLASNCQDTLSPSLIRVKLNELHVKAGSGTRKCSMHSKPDLGGNQTAKLLEPEPFKCLGPHESGRRNPAPNRTSANHRWRRA